MASRKFGSRDDLELSPVITKPGHTAASTDTSDSEEDLENNPPKEGSPMLQKPPQGDKYTTRDPPPAYSSTQKPIPKPKPKPKPKPQSQSQKSLQSLGKEEGEPSDTGHIKPVVKPRNQSKLGESLGESPALDTGETSQGIPPIGHQSSAFSSPATRQGEYPSVFDDKPINTTLQNTGELTQADTTSIGEVSQVQQFNFVPTNQAMGDVDEQPSPTGMLGWLGFGLSVFALACLCVSFASPYWMQAYPLSFNEFQNMGLWEVCMQDYMHHKDDSMDVYDGCWWVFNRDEKYWKLREWLLPPWFITCQVMVTMNLICQFATIGIVAMIFLHCCPVMNHEYHQSYAMFAAAGLCFFITILTLITGVMYALFCGDRNWMPRPDLNFISWGYGFLIIQGIISTGAGVCYFLEAQKAFNELDRRDQEYTKAVLDMDLYQGQPSYSQSYDAGSQYSQSSYNKQAPPSYPGTTSYNTQPSYDAYSGTGPSEKGGSMSYDNSRPAYPGYS